MPQLILASTSRYRRELLERLRLPFDVLSRMSTRPRYPARLRQRSPAPRAREGTLVAQRHPDAVVIGSDQVADLDGEAIGKPGTHERAVTQLRRMRGPQRRVPDRRGRGMHRERLRRSALVPVTVRFRRLDDAEIERYLRAEQPYDCAGSAKAETLGIALLDAIESNDPTALIGLPLIKTCALLRAAGIDPLAASSA
jgi:septum formation protein